MQKTGTYTVHGTDDDHRKCAPYDFVVVLSPDTCKELGLRDYVVIARKVDDSDDPPDKKKTPLRVYGVLVQDTTLGRDEIRMDQTLRNALGIPFELDVHQRSDLSLFPLELTLTQRLLAGITSLLGRRYLFLRVAKPYPPDIEKTICRVPKDALSLMGTDEGNRIVLVSCTFDNKAGVYRLKNYSVKAFDLPHHMEQEREDMEEESFREKGWTARYVCPTKLLEVNPDISRIFLDAHERRSLQVEPGDPIKARRDFLDLMKRQLLEVGVLLAISAIALTSLLPDELKAHHSYLYAGIAVFVSVLISAGVILASLKSRVR